MNTSDSYRLRRAQPEPPTPPVARWKFYLGCAAIGIGFGLLECLPAYGAPVNPYLRDSEECVRLEQTVLTRIAINMLMLNERGVPVDGDTTFETLLQLVPEEEARLMITGMRTLETFCLK